MCLCECHAAKISILLMQKRVNRHFEALFETGVDEMSWDDTVRTQFLDTHNILTWINQTSDSIILFVSLGKLSDGRQLSMAQLSRSVGVSMSSERGGDWRYRKCPTWTTHHSRIPMGKLILCVTITISIMLMSCSGRCLWEWSMRG